MIDINVLSTQITTTTSTYTLVVFYVVEITYYFCVPAPAISHHQAMEYPAEFSYCVWKFLDVHEGLVVDLLIDAGLKTLLFKCFLSLGDESVIEIFGYSFRAKLAAADYF